MSKALVQAKIFITQLKKSGIPAQSAILFGSHAKGTANKFSDIDICIISPKFGRNYITEMMKLRRIAIGIDVNIEPIPMTPKDLADPYSSLSTEIRITGQKI